MEVLIIVIIVIAALISIIKEHSGIIIAVLLLGGYLYIASKFGIGVIKAILGAVVFAVLLGIVVNIFAALITAYRKSRKRRIIKNICRYFRRSKPTASYNIIKNDAFRRYGGIKFKLDKSESSGFLSIYNEDTSDYYVDKELNAFVERNQKIAKRFILNELNEKGAIDNEELRSICQKYGKYCIGDMSFKNFAVSTLEANSSKAALNNGETIYKNSSGGTNLKINEEISEDDL